MQERENSFSSASKATNHSLRPLFLGLLVLHSFVAERVLLSAAGCSFCCWPRSVCAGSPSYRWPRAGRSSSTPLPSRATWAHPPAPCLSSRYSGTGQRSRYVAPPTGVMTNWTSCTAAPPSGVAEEALLSGYRVPFFGPVIPRGMWGWGWGCGVGVLGQ